MTAPKPMDPERLALFRQRYGELGWLIPNGEARDYVRDLLADRDYHVQRADAGAQADASLQRELSAECERHRNTLAERNDARAEVTRLRARVRVEAEDVERAGVTAAGMEAWLTGNGWAPIKGIGSHPSDGRFCNWGRRKTKWSSSDSVSVFERGQPARIAQSIATLARHHDKAGLDILDEMAAMEVGS